MKPPPAGASAPEQQPWLCTVAPGAALDALLHTATAFSFLLRWPGTFFPACQSSSAKQQFWSTLLLAHLSQQGTRLAVLPGPGCFTFRASHMGLICAMKLSGLALLWPTPCTAAGLWLICEAPDLAKSTPRSQGSIACPFFAFCLWAAAALALLHSNGSRCACKLCTQGLVPALRRATTGSLSHFSMPFVLI